MFIESFYFVVVVVVWGFFRLLLVCWFAGARACHSADGNDILQKVSSDGEEGTMQEDSSRCFWGHVAASVCDHGCTPFLMKEGSIKRWAQT